MALILACVQIISTWESNILAAYNAVLPKAISANDQALRNSEDIQDIEIELRNMSLEIERLMDENRELRERLQDKTESDTGTWSSDPE